MRHYVGSIAFDNEYTEVIELIENKMKKEARNAYVSVKKIGLPVDVASNVSSYFHPYAKTIALNASKLTSGASAS